MITTVDNPYNPFTQWDEWRAFDLEKGHCCCEYLARLTSTSDSLSETENQEIINDAMQTMLKDPLGIYRLIGPKETPVPIDLETLYS